MLGAKWGHLGMIFNGLAVHQHRRARAAPLHGDAGLGFLQTMWDSRAMPGSLPSDFHPSFIGEFLVTHASFLIYTNIYIFFGFGGY